MKTNRELLLEKLEQVKWGLASREIIDQSASYVFKNGKIYTFNDEIFCSIDHDLEIEGAVHAEPFLALLNKLTEEDVDIDVKEKEVLVKGKNSRAGIRMDKEILLPIDDMEQPTEWNNLSDEFMDAVEIVQGCASRQDSNFELTCVHLHPEFLEACDNFQMVRYPLESGLKSRSLVRKGAIKQITGLGMQQVCEGKSWIHFRSATGLQSSCRKWEDKFPDISQFLICNGSKVTFPGGLLEAIEKAEIFSADNPENDQVRIDIKEGRLRLKGMGARGWYEERRKIAYEGRDISFLIPPKLLVEITKRTNECEISEGSLKIDAEKFVYVACLGAPEE